MNYSRNDAVRERAIELLPSEVERFRSLHPRSAAYAEDAKHHLLGGVPMPWMTRWPGPFPIVAAEAHGGRINDVDGLEYVDFSLGDTGAMCGHAPGFLAPALAAQAARGITTMLPSSDASWVAEELTRRFGLPTWQFAMTATDANRFVLRLARWLTQRPKVVVMDWCYHGSVDESLAVLGSDGSTVARTSSVGPPVDPALTTRVVAFNDIDALRAALSFGDVACVLMEPALTNIGIVLPETGYLDAVRQLTREHDVLLVIDETHTICCGPGGATATWRLEPDFLTIGKAIGGGMPTAAYGMTDAIAAALAPLRNPGADVSGIGGTLTANALALAAMRATLSNALRAEDFVVSIPLAESWTRGVQESIDRHGLHWTVQRLGCRAEYWFCPPPRTGAAAAAASDHDVETFLHLWCLNRGVLLTPFHNMALLAPCHTESDVALHTQVFDDALALLTR